MSVWRRCLQFDFLIMLVGVFLAAAFLLLIPYHYWSDSEIWGVRSAAACFDDWRRYACSTKPMFSFLMALLHSVTGASDVIPMMRAARVSTLFFWALSALLFLRKRPPALWVIYAGTTLFFFDAGVARSDFWALPFLLLHYSWLESTVVERRAHKLVPIVFAATVAVLITPKAAFSLLALLPWHVAYFRNLERQRKIQFSLIVAAMLVLAGVCTSLRSDAEYFLHLFARREYGFSYWSSIRFFYLKRAALENPPLALAVFLWLAVSLRNFARRPFQRERALTFTSGVLLLCLLVFYPDKLPFWIAGQTLLLLFVVGPDFAESRTLKRGAQILAALALVNAAWIIFHLGAVMNTEQVNRVRALQEKITASQPISVYDGLGLFGGATPPNEFFGPGQKARNEDNVDRIRKANFDVIILTHKVEPYRPFIESMLNHDYFEVAPSIFLRVRAVRIKNVKDPAKELSTALRASFPLRIRPDREIGMVSSNRIRTFPLSAIGEIGPLCRGCREPEVLVTPFGRFFSKGAYKQTSFGDWFWFEPKAREAYAAVWEIWK